VEAINNSLHTWTDKRLNLPVSYIGRANIAIILRTMTVEVCSSRILWSCHRNLEFWSPQAFVLRLSSILEVAFDDLSVLRRIDDTNTYHKKRKSDPSWAPRRAIAEKRHKRTLTACSDEVTPCILLELIDMRTILQVAYFHAQDKLIGLDEQLPAPTPQPTKQPPQGATLVPAAKRPKVGSDAASATEDPTFLPVVQTGTLACPKCGRGYVTRKPLRNIWGRNM
jgi:hypothetical protein